MRIHRVVLVHTFATANNPERVVARGEAPAGLPGRGTAGPCPPRAAGGPVVRGVAGKCSGSGRLPGRRSAPAGSATDERWPARSSKTERAADTQTARSACPPHSLPRLRSARRYRSTERAPARSSGPPALPARAVRLATGEVPPGTAARRAVGSAVGSGVGDDEIPATLSREGRNGGDRECAPGGSRTPDQEIRRLLLYPLSYWGVLPGTASRAGIALEFINSRGPYLLLRSRRSAPGAGSGRGRAAGSPGR